MSSLIFGGPQKATLFEQEVPANSVTFDASVSENHDGGASITDHPVEDGSDISDHIRRTPDSLTISVIVSNHPVILLRSALAQSAVLGGGQDISGTRAEDAYDFVRLLKNDGVLVGVSTTLRDYSNMAITSLSVTRDAVSGNMVAMNISVREITIARTESVAAPDPVNPSRSKKTQLGKKTKPPVPPTAATATKSKGFLLRGAEALGKFIAGN